MWVPRATGWPRLVRGSVPAASTRTRVRTPSCARTASSSPLASAPAGPCPAAWAVGAVPARPPTDETAPSAGGRPPGLAGAPAPVDAASAGGVTAVPPTDETAPGADGRAPRATEPPPPVDAPPAGAPEGGRRPPGGRRGG